ncbi:MAG: hypothetical protein PUF50_05385 [Erysipelotrichaceae bacterium]|nr:hypothetical protein [Erysipelotrichaceae bacterium]
MKEELYLRDRTAVINFTSAYYQTAGELLSSKGFSLFLKRFLTHLAVDDIEVFEWIVRKEPLDEFIPKLIQVLKLLMIMDVEDLQQPTLETMGSIRLLSLVEKGYDYWRKLERFTIVSTSSSKSLQFASFIEADQKFNALVISIYRTISEKLQGTKNRVYRQMSAGSNGSIVLRSYRWNIPEEYHSLKNIPFIHTIMLRTPLLLYPRSNKRVGSFVEVDENPIHHFVAHKQYWMCYPAKVGSLLIYIYFHQDFLSSGVSLANLFELASEHECTHRKPDAIVLFGNEDEKNETTFYHDVKNDIWVGSVSYAQRIEYFGYLKKMSLTLHNVAKMAKGWLPIHGAMVNIYLRNGARKGVVLIGDSGAGKSESIEALKNLGNEEIAKIDIIFDDMGSFHIEDHQVYAQGTEIGAFVRLDDLDKGTAYRDMERSIFMNPESSNARVILPSSSYDLITSNQVIDMVLYANNYENKRGMHRFENVKEAKEVFIQGKRMALGTTQEKGLSMTYFANPFGPMQQQDVCGKIFEDVFDQLYKNQVYVGEIYTCLGVAEHKDGLQDAASQLLEYLKNN